MARVRLGDVYDLEDLALEIGASIEFTDGRKFNTMKAQSMRTVKEDSPQPQMIRSDNTAEILKQIVLLLSRPVEVVIPPMPAPQVTVNLPEEKKDDEEEDKPVRWVFEFERNPNGTIKRIEATSSTDD
jgi:hypothetical protein